MEESLTKVTVFDAGLPSIGVEPKSICSFYILRLGMMAEAFMGMSIFFEPLTTIVAQVSMLQGLREVTLKMISEAYSAAMLPFLGEGIITDSYSLGMLILYMVGTFDRFLRWIFC
jgi:hypothetical protein